MSKPVLLSLGAGKVQELAGTNDNDVLTWDAATSEWKAEAGGGGGSTVTMGGDVTGSSDNATVAKIQNIPISTTDPTTGKILQYDGTQWAPANAPQGGSGGGGVLYYLNKGTPVTGGNLPANTYQLGRTAEATQSSVALTNLATGSWTRVGGFVSDASDPSITTIPAGLWDFNLWIDSTAASNNQAFVRVTLYGYDGSTNPEAGTVLAQTDNIYLYDAGVIAQYIAAMLIAAGTTLPSTSTRLYLLLEARASTSNRDVTVYFGNSTPTHTHTTVPSVAGTGLVHVIDGVFQTPASAVDLESNGASGDVTGVLKLANGGTNASLTATAGGAVYGTGTALGVTAAGTTGTVLVSDGANAPSFTTIGGTAFGSQTTKYVFAAPAGADGNPSFRQLTTSDINGFSSNAVTSLIGTANQVLVNGLSGAGNAQAGQVTLTLPSTLKWSSTAASASYVIQAGDVTNTPFAAGSILSINGGTANGSGLGGGVVISGGSSPTFTGGTLTLLAGTGATNGDISIGETNTANVYIGSASITSRIYGTLTLPTNALAAGQGGTGVRTASANTVFAGPTTGAAAAPSFRALVAADFAGLTPYDISGEFVGTPASGATIMRFVAARAFTFGGTAYFVCTSNTGATTAVFTVSVNGVSKGTVSILGNATSGTGTITSTSIAAGDLVSVVATTPANVINPYWTLPGTV